MTNRPTPLAVRTKRLEAFDSSWTKTRFANGLQAIHIPTPGVDHFYLGVMVKAGARIETPKLSGITHFLEHMMFRGSDRFPDFTDLAREFEWLGGEWNAATGHEHTEFWYAGIRHTAPQVIRLFSEFITNPKLADLEIERQIILREIEGDLNDHGHSTDLEHHMAEILWPGTTLALPILGTEDSVQEISLEDLRHYRTSRYTPSNMVLCAVGGDGPDEIMAELEKSFGAYRQDASGDAKASFTPAIDGPGGTTRWVEHSDNEYGVLLSFRCGGEWSQHMAEYDAISRILADGFCSRLSHRLRETLGLVYDVSADNSHFVETGAMDISANVHTDNLDRFFTELFAQIRELTANGPSEEEVARAALRCAVDLELSPDHPEDFGSKLCWSALCDQEFSLVKEREQIAALTQDRVAATCRDLFRLENAGLVCLGPGRDGLADFLKNTLTNGLKS